MMRQHKYILDILTRDGMTSCKPVDTPVSPSKVILLPDHSFSDPTRFRQIVGALQYLTFTRPDICFVVNIVCQFMHAPTDSHCTLSNAFYTILKVRHLMVSISLKAPLLLYMVYRCRLGWYYWWSQVYGQLSCLFWLDVDFLEIRQATDCCSLLY